LFGKSKTYRLIVHQNFFCFIRPIITLNWSQIVLHSNNVFEFSTIEPLRKKLNENDLQINDARHQNDSGKIKN